MKRDYKHVTDLKLEANAQWRALKGDKGSYAKRSIEKEGAKEDKKDLKSLKEAKKGRNS